MLQSEITPFADAHREALDLVLKLIEPALINPLGGHITTTQARKIQDVLKQAQNGFNRFEACAHDEWRQKENYRKMFLQTKGIHT